MVFQPGDVVLVPFPFTDLSTSKARPAVVVSSARYHASEPDVILGAITSQLSAATGPFDYVLRDWRLAGLRFPSAFKPILATLEPSQIVYQVGALSAADWNEIRQQLREMLDL